jgi:predicted permease
MSTLSMELRHALRQLARRPAFVTIAVLSLGLGIGATSLLYTLINAVLLRPPAGIVEPARVLDIGRSVDGEGFDTLTDGDLRLLREDARTLDQVYGYAMRPLNFGRPDATVRALGLVVSESYFDALGVRAQHGRVFDGPESAPGANPAVVVGHAAWQRWFGADPQVVGRKVRLNGADFTLLGVLPPDFRGHVALLAPDFYIPVSMIGSLQSGGAALLGSHQSHWLKAGARLAPGATLEAARAELAALARRSVELHPDLEAGRGFEAYPIRGMPRIGAAAVATFSAVLFGLVGLVLLVACVNVAGMLLAHGESRLQEVGVRYALGARRARVVRQLLIEAGLLALGAGALGLVIAWQGDALVRAIPLPIPVPIHVDVAPDWRVLAFTLGLCVLATALFGLLPALRTSRVSPRTAMAQAGSGGTPRRTRMREVLVVAQIAFTLVLLVVTGLFARALQRAQGVATGMRTAGVLVAELDLDPSGLPDERSAQLALQLLERLRAEPGVESAALGAVVPLTLSDMGYGGAWKAGDGERPTVFPSVNLVSDGYLGTLGIDLRGRDFGPADQPTSEPVVVINETLARQLYGDADPIGRTFDYEGFGERKPVRVIGLVRDGKYASLGEEPKPFAWLALAQLPRGSLNLFARTELPAAEFARRVAAHLRAVDPDLPPGNVHRFDDLAALGVLPQRVGGVASASMGALGLLLAAMGLYGVIAFHVAQRTREFGIRLALGAGAAQLRRSVLLRALRIAAIGVAIGTVLSTGMANALAGLLFGIDASDAIAFGGAAALLFAIGIAASWLPARRAAGLEPLRALRNE